MRRKTKAYLVAGLVLAMAGAVSGAMGLRTTLLEHRLNQAKTDIRDLHTGICTYAIDRCGVFNPPDTTLRLKDARPTFETDIEFITHCPVNKGEPIEFWQPLTTPLAYMGSIPGDPFRGGEPYGYLAWNFHDETPVLAVFHSPGPDGDDDLDLWDLKKRYEEQLANSRDRNLTVEVVKASVRDLVFPYFYDPTNGITSNGDIISVNYSSSDVFDIWRADPRWLKAPGYNSEHIRKQELSNQKTAYVEGAPLPPPQDSWVERTREAEYPFPRTLAAKFKEVGIDITAPYADSDSEFWRAGAGRLGRDFGAVIESPSAWNEESAAALAEWKHAEPDFWRFIESLPAEEDIHRVNSIVPENTVAGKRDTYYAIAPILGKSLALHALTQLAEGKLDEAERSAHALQNLTFLLFGEAIEVDPHVHRIYLELTRIHRDVDSLILKAQYARDPNGYKHGRRTW